MEEQKEIEKESRQGKEGGGKKIRKKDTNQAKTHGYSLLLFF
jgi:hypothetical protein